MTAHAWHALAQWFAPIGHRLEAIQRRLDRLPRWVGPTVLLALSAIFIGAVLYGGIFARPNLKVRMFDAGPVSDFAIGKVNAFPAHALYLIGMTDGTIRAVDARVPGSNCTAEWRPDDPRGSADNPNHMTGVFVDPCSQAVWSAVGDAISGTNEPLRTPQVSYPDGTGGVKHVMVETVNDPAVP